jgi:hypothetical protein
MRVFIVSLLVLGWMLADVSPVAAKDRRRHAHYHHGHAYAPAYAYGGYRGYGSRYDHPYYHGISVGGPIHPLYGYPNPYYAAPYYDYPGNGGQGGIIIYSRRSHFSVGW